MLELVTIQSKEGKKVALILGQKNSGILANSQRRQEGCVIFVMRRVIIEAGACQTSGVGVGVGVGSNKGEKV